tara:strand:+ start:197 stop:964 length:768 start_codon:yes stop_codon:yes gene_type:complete
MCQVPITLLTPFNGDLLELRNNINKNINELALNDKWIVVFDNITFDWGNLVSDERVIFLAYGGECGAGNARNFGLKYIENNMTYPFLLLPIDADDFLVSGSLEMIKKSMCGKKDNMVSFGHIKNWPNRRLTISYDGFYTVEDLLKRYVTPCGSTILRITEKSIFNEIQFSRRKRANDNLFFLQAAKYFGGFRCCPSPVLVYNVGNPNSLSGKKYKQIFYKYLALRDFGLSRFHAIYLLGFYIITGVKRYIFKQSL